MTKHLFMMAGLVLLIWCYSQTLMHDYVLLDDVTASINTHWPNPTIDYYAAEGRPLYGYMLRSWKYIESVRDFRWVRFYSFCTMLLLYVMLVGLFRDVLEHQCQRVGVAICLLTLPAAGLAVLWASMFQVLTATLASFWAANMAWRSWTSASNLKIGRILAGVALIIISLMLYQPAAMLYFFILGVKYWGVTFNSSNVWTEVRRCVSLCATYGMAMLIYLLWYRLMIPPFHIVHTDNEFIMSRRNRSGMVESLTGKLEWFVMEFTPDFLVHVFIFDDGWTRIVAIILTLATLLLGGIIFLGQVKRTDCTPVVIKSALLAVLLVATAHQHLLIAESVVRYRIGAAYSFFITFASFAAIMWMLYYLRISQWVRCYVAPISLTMFFVVYAQAGYKKYFVDILSRESVVLEAAVRPLVEDDQRRIIVIKPDWANQPHPNPPNYELGFYSSASWPEAAMQFAAFTINGELAYFETIKIVEPADSEVIDNPQDWPIINLENRLAEAARK